MSHRAELYTLGDIEGATLSISIPKGKYDAIDDVVHTLQAGKFHTTKAYRADFSDTVDKFFTRIMFVGNGFEFGLLKSKFSVQFLSGLEFATLDLNRQDRTARNPSEIFTAENMNRISIDFNYILALILGDLELVKNNYEINCRISVSKNTRAIYTLNHLLAPELKSNFVKANNFELTGIGISMTEKLFDEMTQSEYRLSGFNKKSPKTHPYYASALFKFKSSGPIDLFNIIDRSIKRLNKVVESVVGVTYE